VKESFFRIAGHDICLRHEADEGADMLDWLPSFEPFATERPRGALLLTLTILETLHPDRKKQLIRNFDTGNGETAVSLLPDGGYEFIIHNVYGRPCCLLTTNDTFSDCRCALKGDWTMRSFGLNNALMLVYAFASSNFKTVLIHASCIAKDAVGYPFIAESGTGKSTHTALWMKHIEGAELLNDDNPIIRIMDDGLPYIFGSPWSGKTPCYRNRHAPLGAVTRIARATVNSIEKHGPVEAFATLLPACSTMKWDATVYGHLCDTISMIIETTPVYTLHCRPDEEAARLSCETITRRKQVP